MDLCMFGKNTFFILLVIVLSARCLFAQQGPKVLIVTAHPDDDASCAATVYKITHDLKGNVDLALITNGEGGYKYSTLAEDYYGKELTEEKTGREALPTIRKKELMAGGAIVGVRNYFFFDQQDNMYTLEMHDVLTSVWDTASIKHRLKQIIKKGRYDYIFCLLPVPETHGHHKSATLMALQTAQELPAEIRPVVLGVSGANKTDTVKTNFSVLPDYPVTAINLSAPVFIFDKTQPFGFRDKLNYKIIVNWLIAEHKSQGTMQLLMNEGDFETFRYFSVNPPEKINQVKELFQSISINRFKKKNYE
jgi:N-acetylglucosamine malate deacetylase 2